MEGKQSILYSKWIPGNYSELYEFNFQSNKLWVLYLNE